MESIPLPIEEPASQEKDRVAAAGKLHNAYMMFLDQFGNVIVGLNKPIEQIFITLICGGHAILEGVPGLAKTRMISTLAEMTELSFRRIQFTPDLMPGDITGSDVLEEDSTTGKRSFRFIEGPLFGNVILADEINRTPPKTQSALLEAMEERQLTSGGNTYKLPDPFLVLATQNPIEQEGTYPMPEAQLDRFMMKVILDYPDMEEELEVMRRTTTAYHYQPESLLGANMIREARKLVRDVVVAWPIYEFTARLVRATRPGSPEAAPAAEEMLSWGAGPRASINLLLASKARALLKGRHHVATEDVLEMARPVLRHRISRNFQAEAHGHSPDDILLRIFDDVQVVHGSPGGAAS
ncbi:MAG: AAA family ATPase [Verrucomicrobiales bacterium]|nr:AAA family ATPase [Verrucomicrobiales bacterium]